MFKDGRKTPSLEIKFTQVGYKTISFCCYGKLKSFEIQYVICQRY